MTLRLPSSSPTLRAPLEGERLASAAEELPPQAAYADPLERIWVGLWRRLGLSVTRSASVYASSDGHGGLQIGVRETLDADDCLAQMLLHELCHALVEGPPSFQQPDWGLDNTDERHVPHEHAALRLQAQLLGPHGLRRRLAPTTEFRPYYDALGAEPLGASGPDDEEAVRLARGGLERARQEPVGPWLQEALRTTRLILEAADRFEALIEGRGPRRERDRSPESHAPDRRSPRT